ncbi:MAG: AAA family ATPase [Bacteroidia bacterium]|nr:AAA family ATPase [Bacteroidia bacterium]
MNIECITIQNFRNIGDEQTFLLNKHFTAIIGINGKGKSTILHALRVASGSYFLGIPNSEVKSRHIHKDEIRFIESAYQLVPQFPVKVEATGIFPGRDNSITWRRQWLEGKSSATTKHSDVGSIKDIATSNYYQVTKEGNDKIALPLIAFFGISRAVGAGRVTQQSRAQQVGRIIFRQGYQDWEEMRAVKFHYPEWLGRYDLLLKEQKEYAGTKDAFFNAIKKANPYISHIEFAGGELWVKAKIDKDETSLLPISLHSDGVHYFTEMVAELAYRCIVLNGFKENKAIEEAVGIVMIDELDLHLHPKWQRHVVNDLKTAFPNIQFVVTTHSAFIVQSLKSEELIILDEQIKKDGDPDMKGIEDVAANEMGVEDVPRSEAFLEMQQVAEEYYALIQQGKSSKTHEETARLRDKLNELEERFSNDPAFVASLRIERQANDL